jgi:molybdopterin-guanine dinucleotide biosynthesis protein A
MIFSLIINCEPILCIDMAEENKIIKEIKAPIKDVSGVILAGGKSRRFGSNKAFADINGQPLISRVISVLRPIFDELIIITNNPDDYAFLGLPMYEDLIKGLGPIGGIYTGLEKIQNSRGFFAACDMPFLNEKLIQHLAGLSEGFEAVVPKIDWKMEPLHAVYSKECLPTIKELIGAGECMINRFFQRIRVRFLNEDELKLYDPLLRSFYNINKPDELYALFNGDGI